MENAPQREPEPAPLPEPPAEVDLEPRWNEVIDAATD
jgi:hypothetical protein